MTRKNLFLSASLATALVTVGCESGLRSGPPSNVMLEGTVLDRHQIGVEPSTEVLEIDLDGDFPTLRIEDRRRIESFVNAYRDRGFGDLRMVLPENSATPGLAVEAVKEAREIAWTRGISWEAIDGSAYDAQGTNAPIILAFDVYNAVAPDCKSLAAYDLSDIRSNNEFENFGCTIKHNIAQMIADPTDLLGQRPLDRRDNGRVSVIMEAYRQGEATAAAVGGENVTVSGVGG
ncbi:MAG: CpaD family pilus assembly protein [Pseudomonadota bacterium]